MICFISFLTHFVVHSLQSPSQAFVSESFKYDSISYKNLVIFSMTYITTQHELKKCFIFLGQLNLIYCKVYTIDGYKCRNTIKFKNKNFEN